MNPIERWWRQRTNYPAANIPFRPTDDHDLLRSMRAMMRFLSIAVVVLAGIVVCGVAGIVIPEWTPNLIGVAGVGVMFATTPPARYILSGMVWSSLRKQWAAEWDEAGVPLSRLWMMRRSPVSVAEFRNYADALEGDPSARLEGGTDPRVVWALAERNVTPTTLVVYRTAGANARNTIALCEANVSPEEWAQVINANIIENPGDSTRHSHWFGVGLQFVNWARTGRASLHPSEFATESQRPSRTVGEVLPHLEAWTTGASAPTVHLAIDGTPPCPLAENGTAALPCDHCQTGNTQRHRAWFINKQMNTPGTNRTVKQWVEMAGCLAPHFIHAKIGFEDAEQMLADDPNLTVETLVFLAAWDHQP